ncbi:retrotransposable element Tf2 [Tanacetum coccineum]
MVGHNPELRKEFLQYYHGGAVGGHSGVKVTTHKICLSLYWKGLGKQVKQYVRECLVCQKCKPHLATYPGLLQPLPIPKNISTSISMDLIEGLPKSQGKNVIFMVVDRLNKYTYFIALSDPFTPRQVVQPFMDNVYKLHGMPKYIVFDRDKVFLTTQSTPFEIVHGIPPPIHVPYLGGLSKVEAVDRTLKAREEAIQIIKFHLIMSQNKMKQQADQGRSKRSFEIGDWVSLIGRKMVKKRNVIAIYGLVQWTNGNVEDATWEPLDKLSKD